MGTLAIDLETYSETDIRKAGLYRYAENCEIILFAYAFDDGPVKIVDMLQGETLPAEVLEGLKDGSTLKTAYNAAFEMNVIENALGIDCNPKYWECTMVQGYMLGLPGGLDLVGKILKLSEDKAKMAEGKRLIRYFSVPCRPSKANGGRTRNLPEHYPDKWKLFKEYCKRDVEAEREIRHKLGYLLSDGEHSRAYAPDWNLWELDQRINRAGVLIDTALVDKAVEVDGMAKEVLMREARELTGLANPGSRAQCLEWLGREGLEVETFDKAARKELLKDKTLPANVRRFIEIKDLLGKTSVKKYVSMKNAMCRDGRVRGMLQFYGASRTGRWAGRLVQLHNLPQNHMEDLDEVRAIIKNCDFETIDFIRDNVADDLSQLIRTAFIAGGGRRFIVADFAAIEARVIAWLAGETWRQEAFKNGEDIYCASASQMFGVPVVKHGINGELRQKGKVAELACGYGGGVNALKAFGADRMGLSDDDMAKIVRDWRNASPNVVGLWGKLENAAKSALRTKGQEYRANDKLSYCYWRGVLTAKLPSGRSINYVRPSIKVEEVNGREKESLEYYGTSTAGGWSRCFTWGGKLTENAVQAIARDCLAEAMMNLDRAGYKIVMHVHDEVILEMPYGKGSLEEAAEIMGRPIGWAEGLLLRADGYETEYYRKD